jgi:hypothetical protein
MVTDQHQQQWGFWLENSDNAAALETENGHRFKPSYCCNPKMARIYRRSWMNRNQCEKS